MTLYNLPYLLLDRRTGWQVTFPASGVVADESLQLQPLPGNARPLADASGDFGGLTLPTGLALDSQGRIYILNGDTIRRYDRCEGAFRRLAHIGGRGSEARCFWAPQGLAISVRDDLFVADTGNRRVQVFAVKGLPLRAVWGPYRVALEGDGWRLEKTRPSAPDLCEAGAQPTYPEGTWRPWDIVLTAGCWAYVSDRDNGLIHRFDPQGRWRGVWDGVNEQGAALVEPTHLALDCDENLYVVQAGQPDVVVLDREGHFLRRVSLPAEVKADFAPARIGFDSAGRLHLTDGQTGCVYIFDDTQTTAASCKAVPGRGCAIAFDSHEGRTLIADQLGGRVYELDEGVAYPAAGTLLLGPLDSEIYRCEWHRLVVDGRIEAGTTLQVQSLTADAPKAAAQVAILPDNRWATGAIRSRLEDGAWDCLLRSQPGRYLWLRLTLRGDEMATPTVRSLRVEYPRRTSLNYLPAVFREDSLSADFLARFLSIMDTKLGEITDLIDHMAWLFDPRSTLSDPDFLGWLAGWLGLALDQAWPEATRRRLVAEAHRLYALRGTPAGLKLQVQLVTGLEPQILEHYRLRRWLFLNQGRLGSDTVLWGAEVIDRLQLNRHSQIGSFQLRDIGDPLRDPFHTYAHQYTLYAPTAVGERQQALLEEMVAYAAPAHTSGAIQPVGARMCVGRQSIIGVNTVIARYPSGVTLDGGGQRLGDGTVLSPSQDESKPPQLRVGVRARIGSSTHLN